MKRDTLLTRYQEALWVVGVNTGGIVLAPHAVKQMGIAEGDAVELEGLGPVDSPFITADIIYDGNLGATFIKNRVITIDLPRSRVFAGRP